VVAVGGERERRVQLEVGEVREPDQAREVADRAEADLPAALARQDRRLDPVGPVRGAFLLEEMLALDAVGIAFQRQRAAREVGGEDRRDPGVVVDHLPLAEADLRIEDLVEVRQFQLPPLDLDHDAAAG
jgi:hypothetical protein